MAEPASEGVVVLMARSRDEARAARDALVEAGIPVALSDAAIEEAFASGKRSLAVRVGAGQFEAAMALVDAKFPRDRGGPTVAPAPDAEVEAEPEDPEERERARKEARLRRKLLWRGLKVLFINAFSLFLPGAGVVFAGLGSLGCLVLLRGQVRAISPDAYRLAWVALAVGLISIGRNVWLLRDYLPDAVPL